MNLAKASIAAPKPLNRYRRRLVVSDEVGRRCSYEFSSQGPFRRPRRFVLKTGFVDRLASHSPMPYLSNLSRLWPGSLAPSFACRCAGMKEPVISRWSLTYCRVRARASKGGTEHALEL